MFLLKPFVIFQATYNDFFDELPSQNEAKERDAKLFSDTPETSNWGMEETTEDNDDDDDDEAAEESEPMETDTATEVHIAGEIAAGRIKFDGMYLYF